MDCSRLGSVFRPRYRVAMGEGEGGKGGGGAENERRRERYFLICHSGFTSGLL